MPKRSNDSPSSSSNSSYEQKPTTSVESDLTPLVSPSKKSKVSNKSEKRIRKSWAAEEEAIYLDLIIEHLQDTFPQFWCKVKNDGRLVERGCTGIKVHLASIMNKLKKGV